MIQIPTILTRAEKARRIEKRWRRAMLPPEDLVPTEWAEKKLVLSDRSTARPGPIDFDWNPYAKEPLDQLVNPASEKTTLVWGAQSTKTQTLLAALAYVLANDPGPALWVMPNKDLAKSFSDERVRPLIEDSKVLRRLRRGMRERLSKLEMQFPRMTFALVGSNSPANLASRPIRYLFADEVDKWPEGNAKEGRAIDLVMKRLRSFWNRKAFLTSTPTIPTGAIWVAFTEGSQAHYFVPCPNCGTEQQLVFKQIIWDHSAKRVDGTYDTDKIVESARYHCCHCEFPMRDGESKREMLLNGYWHHSYHLPTKPSYQLPSWYSNWFSYGQAAEEFLTKKHASELLRDWINSTAAEPYDEKIGSATEEEVLAHRGEYPEGKGPERAHALIITADVQETSIWYVIRAWGGYGTSWLIRYGMVETFEALHDVSQGVYELAGEAAYCTHGYIDSGHKTQQVYDFCKRHGWAPIKGVDSNTQTLPIRSSVIDGMTLYLVSDAFFQQSLQTKLKMPNDQPGSWLLHRDTGAEYARELVAEAQVESKDRLGRTYKEWKKFGKNEFRDCEKYQVALAHHAGFRFMEPPPPPVKSEAWSEKQDSFVRRDGRPFWNR